MLLQISPEDWVTDGQTGKQYMVLNTDNFKYDEIQQMCHNHGGFLPEPRDQRENLFLDSLGTEMFVLGMTDRLQEGRWIWESDQTPVTWTGWIFTEPNGGSSANCAVMTGTRYSQHEGHRTDGWIDYNCNSREEFGRNTSKSLICQRNIGRFIFFYTPVTYLSCILEDFFIFSLITHTYIFVLKLL